MASGAVTGEMLKRTVRYFITFVCYGSHLHGRDSGSVEAVMGTSKSYAGRLLNLREGDDAGKKRWAHHGSTRRLWMDADVRQALRYVVEEQGEPMAVFVADGL